MESTIKDNESDNDNIENSSNCPKCLSGDMAKHPPFLSIPLTPSSKIAEKSKTFIEDQDAEFLQIHFM